MSYADSLYKVSINTPAGAVECVGGSFNGVPFFVEESSISGGRNVVTTALPFTADHVNEDLGQKVKEYPIRFYLVGADVEQQREALEEAFNTEGAFELIHPHYGRFFARCTSYSLSFSNSEQEYIAGDVTFVAESDPKKAALAVVDDKGKAAMKARAAGKAASDKFKTNFNPVRAAESIVKNLNSAVNYCLDSVEKARNMMRRYDEFVSNISQIRDNIGTLLKTPGEFAQRIQNIIFMTVETFDPQGGFNGYVNESLVLMDSIEMKDEILDVDRLENSINSLFLMNAAAMVARSALESTFSNAEEVNEMQQNIERTFENAMGKVTDFDDYQTLADLLAVVLKYLTDVVANLAVIVELPLNNSRDALTVCFDCYGSLDRLESVLERNEIVDPMVITRKSLKVLSK